MTSTTPTTHNATHPTFRRLNFSCPQSQKMNTPDIRLTVDIEHWAVVAGTKAYAIQIEVDSRDIKSPYRSTAGMSDIGTASDVNDVNFHNRQKEAIATHLKACNSRSGTLLSSNCTLVTPVMIEATMMKAARMPLRFSFQFFLAFFCSSGSSGCALARGRR